MTCSLVLILDTFRVSIVGDKGSADAWLERAVAPFSLIQYKMHFRPRRHIAVNTKTAALFRISSRVSFTKLAFPLELFHEFSTCFPNLSNFFRPLTSAFRYFLSFRIGPARSALQLSPSTLLADVSQQQTSTVTRAKDQVPRLPSLETMSELPITSKDDVETTLMYDCRDTSTLQGVKYSYWVLGSAHDDDALYMGMVKGNTRPSEHGLEQIKKALSRVPAECIFPPLPFPWWLVRTRVTVADDWDEEPSPDLYLKRPWITNLNAQPGEISVARWFAHEIK